ncbi:MAG TPA: HyaD/HybD family hydrogenase maturation endopeptidase [Thermoanaerobaculia bacterium]|nr:HyaD/HybD family hydrogenase maturation endopeptidase [Thermoanaerobaculia bacterium]
MAAQGSLLILGLGNVLCGDDGLGIAAVELLDREYEAGPSVRVLDGGTLGLSLIGHIQEAEDLILVDAIRDDAAPGSLVRLSGEEVAPAVADRLSVHQIGVADLLDGLRLLEALPPRLRLVGLVPARLSWGPGLSSEVIRALPDLVSAVRAEAEALGHTFVARGDHAAPSRAGHPLARILGL